MQTCRCRQHHRSGGGIFLLVLSAGRHICVSCTPGDSIVSLATATALSRHHLRDASSGGQTRERKKALRAGATLRAEALHAQDATVKEKAVAPLFALACSSNLLHRTRTLCGGARRTPHE
jgi:hypothetical protein